MANFFAKLYQGFSLKCKVIPQTPYKKMINFREKKKKRNEMKASIIAYSVEYHPNCRVFHNSNMEKESKPTEIDNTENALEVRTGETITEELEKQLIEISDLTMRLSEESAAQHVVLLAIETILNNLKNIRDRTIADSKLEINMLKRELNKAGILDTQYGGMQHKTRKRYDANVSVSEIENVIWLVERLKESIQRQSNISERINEILSNTIILKAYKTRLYTLMIDKVNELDVNYDKPPQNFSFNLCNQDDIIIFRNLVINHLIPCSTLGYQPALCRLCWSIFMINKGDEMKDPKMTSSREKSLPIYIFLDDLFKLGNEIVSIQSLKKRLIIEVEKLEGLMDKRIVKRTFDKDESGKIDVIAFPLVKIPTKYFPRQQNVNPSTNQNESRRSKHQCVELKRIRKRHAGQIKDLKQQLNDSHSKFEDFFGGKKIYSEGESGSGEEEMIRGSNYERKAKHNIKQNSKAEGIKGKKVVSASEEVKVDLKDMTVDQTGDRLEISEKKGSNNIEETTRNPTPFEKGEYLDERTTTNSLIIPDLSRISKQTGNKGVEGDLPNQNEEQAGAQKTQKFRMNTEDIEEENMEIDLTESIFKITQNHTEITISFKEELNIKPLVLNTSMIKRISASKPANNDE